MNSTAPEGLSRTWFAAAAALFIFFWASGFVAAKYGFPYAEPFTFLTIRYVIALAVLLPAALLLRVRWPRSRIELAHVTAAGLGVQSIYTIGVYYGIYLGISTGVIALIMALQPLFTAALATPLLGERVTRRQWSGLGIGFAGVALVVAEKVDFATGAAWGFAVAVIGLAAITLGTMYQKRFCAAVDIRAAVTIQNIASLVLVAALASRFETMRVDWTGEFVFALLWSALGLSVIAYGLWYVLVRRGAAARITSLLYLSPPATVLMGWLLFGETLTPWALAGLAVAVIGVALAAARAAGPVPAKRKLL